MGRPDTSNFSIDLKELLKAGAKDTAAAQLDAKVEACRAAKDSDGEVEALLAFCGVSLELGGSAASRKAFAAAKNAAKLFQSKGDKYNQANALGLAAQAALACGMNDDARKAAGACNVLCSELGEKYAQGMMCMIIGRSYMGQAEFQQAFLRGEQAASLFIEAGDGVEIGDAHLLCSQAFHARINTRQNTVSPATVQEWFAKAEGYVQAAKAQYATEAHTEGQAKAALHHSQIYVSLGSIDQAISELKSAQTIFTDLSDFMSIADTLFSLAQAHFFLQEFEEAAECTQKALNLYRDANHTEGVGKCEGYLQIVAPGVQYAQTVKKVQQSAGRDVYLRGHGWDQGIYAGKGSHWVRFQGLRARPAANMRGGKAKS